MKKVLYVNYINTLQYIIPVHYSLQYHYSLMCVKEPWEPTIILLSVVFLRRCHIEINPLPHHCAHQFEEYCSQRECWGWFFKKKATHTGVAAAEQANSASTQGLQRSLIPIYSWYFVGVWQLLRLNTLHTSAFIRENMLQFRNSHGIYQFQITRDKT